MKRLNVILILFAFCLTGFAQDQDDRLNTIDPKFKDLVKVEDSLLELSKIMIMGRGVENRVKASYTFLNLLEEQLKNANSFDYPFDSLYRISIMRSPDGAFNIFTWELLMGENKYRHLGILQVKDKRSVKVYVLNDFSDNIKDADTISTYEKWYGVYYYNIVMKKRGMKRKYYMFGWDLNDGVAYRKLIDVLTFGKDGIPTFGSEDFIFEDYNMTKSKILLEYKKDAGITLNYFPEHKKIMFDHLVPFDEKAKDIMAIPDGSYEGFYYKKGKWHYIDKVFKYKLMDGQAPNG